MVPLPQGLFPGLWLAWMAWWTWTARGTKQTVRIETPGSRLLHLGPLVLSGWLLWVRHVPYAPLNARLWPWAPWQFWTGALLTTLGLLFAVWARHHIGRNWSGTVTVKEDHELIRTGPYGLVRHPIYTGLLLGIAGSALARGEWRSLLAVVIAWAALWRKLRLEERFMTEQFGQRYLDYCGAVPALVPRFWSGPRKPGP